MLCCISDAERFLRMAFSVSLAGGRVDGGDGVMKSAERKSSSSMNISSS